MAKITIDGREIEAPDGAPLVEVIKQSGIYISNLCYIDGLPPYAGCRTCLVEIEGARGLQLSCTTRVTDGMVVRVHSPEAAKGRQAVISIINANHSDRCLTCHRTVKCRPGDICLRDNIVTHRCLTCAKNFRCELQTTSEMLGQSGFEPWEYEPRTYYETEPPEADRLNPFLEFDPQMCIICTRCVRACDDLRHTGAITLAGRGWETRIAFGAGGPVHESNCDFCGACIDVCPTATLMEHPHKWVGHPDKWTPTACTYCSVGCTINLGSKMGRGVIVKPEPSNPVSRDQICVRGRFHYDAIAPSDYLIQPVMRRGLVQTPTSWEQALDTVADRLVAIREQHGPQAVGFLGSPWHSNEENYLLQKLARAFGTNNIDYSGGATTEAVGRALRRVLGTEVLVSDMTDLAQASTVVVVADDLESSHNVACLRIKDAVVRRGARLIVVAPRYGELCDFAQVWLRPQPAQEAVIVDALVRGLLTDEGVRGAIGVPVQGQTGQPAALSTELQASVGEAVAILAEAARNSDQSKFAIVYAVPHIGAQAAEATAQAVASLAVAVGGGERAASLLHVLPSEANGVGLRDMGVAPGLLPGYRDASQTASWQPMNALGVRPVDSPGLSFEGMLAAAREGRLKALVVMGDNPVLVAADRARVEEALKALELLVVISSVMSDTAKLAHVVLPDVGAFGRDGTTTSADRRVLRLRAAIRAEGEARPAWQSLSALGERLAQRLSLSGVKLSYSHPSAIMDEIASLVPLYASARYSELVSGSRQVLPQTTAAQAVMLAGRLVGPRSFDGKLALTTGRSLYISLEAAAIHSAEADKLHRDDFVEINPFDAARLGIADGETVTLRNGRDSMTIRAKVTDAVLPSTVFVPLYYDGGAVTTLFSDAEAVALGVTPVTVEPAKQ